MWVLMHNDMLWGLYTKERLAIQARARAARILGTTIHHDDFNLFSYPVDWLSTEEKRLEKEDLAMALGSTFYQFNK
jgi:hypothetical protein